MRRAAVLAVLAALVLPGRAAADAPFGVTSVPASPRNYSQAYRPASMVRLVVVHATEGSFGGTVSWFRNPAARASANYVVARDGRAVHMVSDSAVAWHSGNGYVNRHSIGVEHEGFTGILATFTDVEYRASARLVAGILRHYVLPIDRRHVIGHSEVPDPFHPGLFGGSSHHTDPGRYWSWSRYMTYVRAYATGQTPPPLPFDVTIPGLALGQTLTGAVRWEAAVAGLPADHVDFLVDGKLRETARETPYVYGGAAATWDTRTEPNGFHVLTVHAVAADGRTADASLPVTFANGVTPPHIVSPGLVEGQTVSGPVRWEVATTGTVDRVEFLVDGVLRDTELRAPYVFGGASGSWNTAAEAPGPHVLKVRAVGPRHVTTATTTVTVAAPATP
jgi:hypothetical protein